jgi:O-antigen biosynthesis protein WbqP
VTRVFDALFAVFGLLFLLPVLLLLWLVGWFDNRSPLFRQERVGRHQMPFVLRRTKLDELPQLWNVLRGEMSLVGPRPCLFNQKELIAERASRGVFDARPGITGLAQIQGIDMSTPELLAETDARMLSSLGLRNYFRFIALTVLGKGAGDRVRG